ncbi:MAG: NfeD family protein [Tumebacillaceae bacterium]
MVEIYWGCLIGGALFALLAVLLGDLISHALHLHALEPVTVVGGIAVFGGAGVLFSEYTSLTTVSVAILSALLAILMSLLVFFLYVRPMKNSENSTAFSMQDLSGRIAEVIVPIPSTGYGEVILRIGAGNTNQIAASFNREEIQAGTRVVVVEVKDDTLYVARYE